MGKKNASAPGPSIAACFAIAGCIIAIAAIAGCAKPPGDEALRKAILERARAGEWRLDPPLEGEDGPVPGSEIDFDTLEIVGRSGRGEAIEARFVLRGSYWTRLRHPDLPMEMPEHFRSDGAWAVTCGRDGTECAVTGAPGTIEGKRGRRSAAASFESCAAKIGRPFSGSFVLQELLIDCWTVLDEASCDGSDAVNLPEREIGPAVKGLATGKGCLALACPGLDPKAAARDPGSGIPEDWCSSCLGGGEGACRSDMFPADGIGTAWLLTEIARRRMDGVARAMIDDAVLPDERSREIARSWIERGSAAMKALLAGEGVDFAALGYPGIVMPAPGGPGTDVAGGFGGAAGGVAVFVTKATFAAAGADVETGAAGGSMDHERFREALAGILAVRECVAAAVEIPVVFSWANGLETRGYVSATYAIEGGSVAVAVEKTTLGPEIAGCVAGAIAGSEALAGAIVGDGSVEIALLLSVPRGRGPSLFAPVPEGATVLLDPRPTPPQAPITKTAKVARPGADGP